MATERRDTKQQRVIWDALEAAARPLSVNELHELAMAELDTLGLSTVYRTVRKWEEDGRIEPVLVPDQPPRYEPHAVAAEHHHHFHCEECDRVFDVDGCPGGLGSMTPPGFELREHHITLRGLCADCAKAG
ncbi:MAG: transcriptional repressor [Planctomycetota bacterium]